MGTLTLQYVTPEELAAAIQPLEERIKILEGSNGSTIPERESGPITVTGEGKVIEGYKRITGGIKATSAPGLVLRNLYVEGIMGEQHILDLRDCPDVVIENVYVHIPGVKLRRLPREQRALYTNRSDRLTMKRFMMRDTGSIKLENSLECLLEEVVGENMRCHALNSGGDPRGYSGQFVQFHRCSKPILQKFRNTNDLAYASTVDNISVHETQGARIFDGTVDGNTDPAGVGVMFESASKGGYVKNVQVLRVCNGAFSVWDTSEATFENVGSRDHYTPAEESQVDKDASGKYFFTGNHEPKSGVGAHFAALKGTAVARYRQARYWGKPHPGQVAWHTETIKERDWKEEDFSVMPPLVLTGWPFPAS